MKEEIRADSTLRVRKTTKKRVEKLGDLGDTWDTLLNDMATFIEERQEEWWDEDEGGEAS